MSNASKQAAGTVEELGGKIKQTVGGVIGNQKMETEGHAKKVEGHAKKEAAKTAECAKEKVEAIKADCCHKA